MWAWTIHKLCKTYGGMSMGRSSWSRPDFQAADQKEQAAFAEKMGPILAEFEQSRQDTFRQVEASAQIWAPLGLAAGIVGAIASTYLIRAHGIEFPLGCIMAGLGGGMYMATRGPVARFEDAFKTKVMPHLLERFGGLQLLPEPTLSVTPMIDAKILPGGTAAIEDQVSGQYRGRAISMAELEITSQSGDETVTSFDGLVLQFELPRQVSGRTIIYPKSWDAREKNQRTSFFGHALPERDGLDPVKFESPDFAQRFTVRSTDQVGARVLLSPAFMERMTKFSVSVPTRAVENTSSFMKFVLASAIKSTKPTINTRYLTSSDRLLAGAINSQLKTLQGASPRQAGHSDVVAVAENGTLLIAIPKAEAVDYFEPPPYWIETNADAVLMHLSIDIQNMLDIADAVFDLDYRTRVENKSGRLLTAA